ncbi:MAG: TetR/AcrR family transcriptional regulator [Acidimicrobiales bacterium]
MHVKRPAATTLFGPLDPLPRGPHGLPAEVVAASQRARLLEALTVTVAARGFASTTVAGVCRAAGVSPNVFYEHFSSKEECFLAAYDVFVSRIVDAIGDAAAAAASWSAFVSDGLGAYLQVLDSEPVAARAFLLEVDGAGEQPRAHLRQTLRGIALLIEQRLASIRAEDPRLGELPTRVYLGIVHGLRALVCEAMIDDPAEQLIDLLPDLRAWLAATVAGAGAVA